jgi:cell division protein FtsB
MNRSKNYYFYFVKLPLLLMIGLLVGMGIFARRGWMDWRRMVGQNESLRKKIELATTQKQSLEKAIEGFRSDVREQERVVRGVLGYVRSDETVIEFN